MKIASMIARILLGAIFAFFGANLLFHFLPDQPMPPGLMHDYVMVLAGSHYVYFVGIFQLVPGILLLVNRYVPLALTILAAEIANIVMTHILMAPSGLPLAAVVVILWFLVFYQVRTAFYPLFQARVAN